MRFDPSLSVSKFSFSSVNVEYTTADPFLLLPNSPQRVWARIYSHGGAVLEIGLNPNPNTSGLIERMNAAQGTTFTLTYADWGPLVQSEIFCTPLAASFILTITQVLYFPER